MFNGWHFLLFALVLTLVIESAAMFSRYRGNRAYFGMLILANIATNITANLALYGLRLITASVIIVILGIVLLEAAAVVLEYLVFREFDKKPRLFIRVLIANVLSVAIGTPIIGALI